MKQAIHYPVIRGKIRLRARLAALQQAIMAHIAPSWSEHRKLSAELDFWINAWDAKLRKGQFWNDDIKDLLLPIGEWSADAENGSIDYATIRWLEARAHGLRILKEVQIENSSFFAGKIVMDIGPGAICFLEASGARIGIAVEPLAHKFAKHNLLLPSEHIVYLPVSAEDLPLLNVSVDIVVSRNNLDHVVDPLKVIHEVYRILRPGGIFLLIVHLEPKASITEPHAFNVDGIHALVSQFEIVRENIYHGGRTESADTLAGLYRKPGFSQ